MERRLQPAGRPREPRRLSAHRPGRPSGRSRGSRAAGETIAPAAKPRPWEGPRRSPGARGPVRRAAASAAPRRRPGPDFGGQGRRRAGAPAAGQGGQWLGAPRRAFGATPATQVRPGPSPSWCSAGPSSASWPRPRRSCATSCSAVVESPGRLPPGLGRDLRPRPVAVDRIPPDQADQGRLVAHHRSRRAGAWTYLLRVLIFNLGAHRAGAGVRRRGAWPRPTTGASRPSRWSRWRSMR